MYNDLVCDLELESEENPGNFPFEDALSELKHSVLRMASNLPASSISTFAAHVLPSLRPYTPTPVLVALLSALFSWDFHEQFVKMISTWITNMRTGQHEEEIEGSEEEIFLEEGKFALSLLDIIFSHAELRTSLMSNVECVSLIIHSLHPFMENIEERLQSDEENDSEGTIPDQLLLATLDLYYRFMLHVTCSSSEAEENSVFSELLTWGTEKVTPILLLPIKDEDEDESSNKRKRDFGERLSNHEFAERVMLIIITICGESIVTKTTGLNFARIFVSESMVVLDDCNLTYAFTESIIRCTTKVIYNIYHGHGGFEKDEGIEVEKMQTTCVRFFEFLFSQVSPKILSKSVRATDFVTLATSRPTLRFVVELLFRKIVEGLVGAKERLQLPDEELFENISDISDENLEVLLEWLVPSFLKSAVMMNALSSYLTNKILGPTPAERDMWKTVQVISLLIKEGSGNKTKKGAIFAPLQNLLIQLKTSFGNEGLEIVDRNKKGGAAMNISEKMEELLQLSYGQY
eukprot:TRINITY_DN6126_c1_g1_i3.p1 TRINITY_DN6126_c1_g1~~TRINITY_DN6126_c1_g1_i3.p1  ORF type:complete len:519 (+),score=78.09 TRINITY_DN6126_c1_g1_i3:999-2555(+)